MKCKTIFLVMAGFAAFSRLSVAQECRAPREMRATLENLDFAQGAEGAAPGIWLLGPEWFMLPHEPVYQARIVSGAACDDGQRCAMVRSVRKDSAIGRSFLYQVVDATQYRGKTLTFRADVRTHGIARLLVRVHQTDGETSFRHDIGDHPITSGNWLTYQIRAPVDRDARDIEFGVQAVGQGEM